MADPAAVYAQLQRHHRRLHTYLRALLPGEDVDAAVREAAGDRDQVRRQTVAFALSQLLAL